ncbi:hypothetical protein AJ80_09781 [Polytolypa hystricis UAMH7299]|uniref:DUF1776-domain-containing protein n=1 Tax=Polytolypa hystricis (strain UAMH7299) TaxID=1447883 RepID=A0A2B7WJU4_POLH7|nr:hypothetical protein AJ80_09781 [Polytolypa hystricis UAMH7299]
MTSDDEFFFGYLASIPNDVRRYSTQVADSIDRHVDHAAVTIRDTLSQQSWLPSSIRPPQRAPPNFSPQLPPPSLISRINDWILSNRAWTAAIMAFVGTGGFLIYGSRKLHTRKRRARRAGNGARKEIVVVAGSPHEVMTRSVASDLERRGYIVFVTVTSAEEERIVRSETREDIRSLWLDLTTTPSTPSEIHPSLHVLQTLITQPQAPMPGVQPHVCQLSGLVLVPSINYPSGPVATISASSWADTINTRLLSPILITQLFLPLLTMKNTRSAILLLCPSIQSSLSAPFASPEVATSRALSGFATSLRQELRLLESTNGGSNIDVIELKLGNIDFGRQFRGNQAANMGTEVLTWQPQQRALYGSTYLSNLDHRLGKASTSGGSYGTSAKELHFAVFDALAPAPKSLFGGRKRKKRTVYVGRGSRTYSIVGNIVPSGLVGWMLGLRLAYSSSLREFPWDSDRSEASSETGWEKLA